MDNLVSYSRRLTRALLSGNKDIHDPSVFHKISLTAFLAWVGLGADGLSSSAYGPEEAFVNLNTHYFLSFFVAIATGLTVIIISISYSQIIELFPSVGGGYVVASKLLSPKLGMISGSALGIIGMFLLIARSYTMGAGTFTGIEAVSNGIPLLREPKVNTAKKTMRFMAVSLSFIVMGLLISYLLFKVTPEYSKTLNAVLFNLVTAEWGSIGYYFVIVTLFSETFILFVAAQAGFIDGPRVLANMANDKWLPTKFSILSDRLVAQNGIILMGLSALLTMIFANGDVGILVVLYSINVFITFFLSQLEMVRHWIKNKGEDGLGVHTLLSLLKTFPATFRNFLFAEVGVVDVGSFKGSANLKNLEEKIKDDTNKANFIQQAGFFGKAYYLLDTEVVNGVLKLSDKISVEFPDSVYFGDQLVFPNETFLSRLLHNQIVFSIQRRLYHKGYTFVILPIRISLV